MNKQTIIDYNKIYHSKSYGDFIIIKEVERVSDRRCVLIKFLNSDPLNPEHFEICKLSDVMHGEVKDHYLKTICGVACIGHAVSCVNGKLDRRYRIWTDMIHRCYDVGYPPYQTHDAKGVTVYTPWLCYEYFLKDVKNIPGYIDWINNEPGVYELDKDTLQPNTPTNQKIYSPTTCAFIPSYRNAQMTDRKQISKIVGVQDGGNGRYRVRFGSRSQRNAINLGTYDDEIAGGNIYNAYALDYNLRNNTDRYIINDIPYMTPLEIKSHIGPVSKFPGVPMYYLVNNNQ